VYFWPYPVFDAAVGYGEIHIWIQLDTARYVRVRIQRDTAGYRDTEGYSGSAAKWLDIGRYRYRDTAGYQGYAVRYRRDTGVKYSIIQAGYPQNTALKYTSREGLFFLW